ncbi:hypothetical protein SprV_0200756900 [Sparganum proliferum]
MLAARELAHHKVDIAVLCETSFSKEGQLEEDLAIETIELLLQSKYDETENRLGHAQILHLLKLCLRTYFTFDGTIYEQVKDTPMGSPISGSIAEAVLQRLESLVFQHHKPKFWARYVDDTFVVIERDQVLTFQEHLNAVFPDIQFTMEEEENNQLAFLDVLQWARPTANKLYNCRHRYRRRERHSRELMVLTEGHSPVGGPGCPPSRTIQHQDWFDDNDAAISNLLAEKSSLHKACVDRPADDNKAPFYRSHRFAQQRLREMQDVWTARKAEGTQGYADRSECENFSAIKAVYGPTASGATRRLTADGTEHFRSVLSRPSIISDGAIARLSEVATNADLDLAPSLHETIRAVQQLSSGRASLSNAIPAEIYKHGDSQLTDYLAAPFQEMWHQGEVPRDFKDATTAHFYKRKWNRLLCDNHRGISFPNTA